MAGRAAEWTLKQVQGDEDESGLASIPLRHAELVSASILPHTPMAAFMEQPSDLLPTLA